MAQRFNDPRQPFGQREPYNEDERPRYFGTGNYSEGGSHFTGGYDPRGVPSTDEYGFDWEAGEAPYGRREFKQGPKGYQRSDERVKEDISERIMRAPNIDASDVTVDVVAGKVTLEGTVRDRYTKHYIEDLADGCPGVQDIENRIRVNRV